MSIDNQTVIPSERLPPELIALIIEELADSEPDLLACSLVCRGWLPFARNNLDLFIPLQSADTFLELIASPTTTLVTTARRVEVWGYDKARALNPLFLALTKFVSLRSLELFRYVPEGLPTLPWLVELRLAYTRFPSYATFVNFMSNLLALRHLHIRNISWTTGPTDGNYAFPPMVLESLVTSWSKKSAIESILFAIRARRLMWSFPRYPSSSDLSTMAYVRHLGNHLKYLELDFGEDIMPTLDLSANTSLGHLRVSDALRFNVIAARDQFDVAVCPTLEPLLSQVMTYARVDTLLLKVRTESRSIPAPWNPLAQLFDLLDTPPFAAIRRVEFVVDGGSCCLEGSARLAKERFEPILRAAILSRSDRQIVCSEGEDPYEIYC